MAEQGNLADLVACLLIAVLGMVAGNVVLFLAGASGGLASRLMRAIHRQSVPVDYGASMDDVVLESDLRRLERLVWDWLDCAVVESQRRIAGSVIHLVKWGDPLTIATARGCLRVGLLRKTLQFAGGRIDQQATRPQPVRKRRRQLPRNQQFRLQIHSLRTHSLRTHSLRTHSLRTHRLRTPPPANPTACEPTALRTHRLRTHRLRLHRLSDLLLRWRKTAC